MWQYAHDARPTLVGYLFYVLAYLAGSWFAAEELWERLREEGGLDVHFLMLAVAAGSAGIEAATNIVVKEANREMLFYVYGAVILLCLQGFRSVRGVLCILIPLGLVSLLSYALMTVLEIGLKVNTLPVAPLTMTTLEADRGRR